MRRMVPLLLLLLVPACLRAFDFGLALDQELGFGGIKGDSGVDYTASLIPRFSTRLGDSGDLLVSAGLGAVYEYEEFAVVPELMHTELSLRFNGLGIMAGRIPYADPLDFVVEGFFDGAQVLYDTSAGAFNAGAWYTGLLYKKSANITISPEDFFSYYTSLDYGDFSDTYFASKRLLLAAGWEHPAVAEKIRLRAAISGQVDLNDTKTPFNSMYISAKAALPFKQLVFQAGACMQIAEAAGETGAGLAWELGASWAPPAPFASQFSLEWRYSNGRSDNSDGLKAFFPITAKPQGDILQAKLSALTAFFLDYSARFSPSVFLSLANSYFIRTDLGTYNFYPVTGNTGYFLGSELFGRFAWYPLSDLSLNLGAGVFIPSSGFTASPKWRVELGLALILY